MSRCARVCAHPEPSSYNAHLAATARAALGAQGWAVTVSDLHAMGFDPCERAAHYPDPLDPARFDVQAEQRHASQNQTLPPHRRWPRWRLLRHAALRAAEQLAGQCQPRQGAPAPVADQAEVRRWCEEQGRDRPGTVQSFGNDLHSAVPGLTTPYVGDGMGGRWRVYEGIRLRCSGDPELTE